MAAMRGDPFRGWTDFCRDQEARIHRKTRPILQRAAARKAAFLSLVYEKLECDQRIAAHASGPRKPDMDHQ